MPAEFLAGLAGALPAGAQFGLQAQQERRAEELFSFQKAQATLAGERQAGESLMKGFEAFSNIAKLPKQIRPVAFKTFGANFKVGGQRVFGEDVIEGLGKLDDEQLATMTALIEQNPEVYKGVKPSQLAGQFDTLEGFANFHAKLLQAETAKKQAGAAEARVGLERQRVGLEGRRVGVQEAELGLKRQELAQGKAANVVVQEETDEEGNRFAVGINKVSGAKTFRIPMGGKASLKFQEALTLRTQGLPSGHKLADTMEPEQARKSLDELQKLDPIDIAIRGTLQRSGAQVSPSGPRPTTVEEKARQFLGR